MIVRIIGKTDVVLSLNATGIQIRGKQIANSVDLDTDVKVEEVRYLEKRGFIQVIEAEAEVSGNTLKDISKDSKIKRSKGTRLPKQKTEQEMVMDAEAETQKEESRVIISIGDGVVESKMTKNAAGELAESEATKASLEAMAKLKEEEEEEKGGVDEDITPISEADLPPEEQMGRGAIIMDQGSDKKVDLANSIVSDSGNTNRDPFIDREDKSEVVKNEDKKSKDKPTKAVELSEDTLENEDKNEDSVADIFAPENDRDSGGKEKEVSDDFIEW